MLQGHFHFAKEKLVRSGISSHTLDYIFVICFMKFGMHWISGGKEYLR